MALPVIGAVLACNHYVLIGYVKATRPSIYYFRLEKRKILIGRAGVEYRFRG